MFELRPDAVAKRREKIFIVFKRVIAEGVATGEFAPVDCHEAATALKDATALFLQPLMIPTALDEETETRARNVVRYVLAGFSAHGSKASARPKPLPASRAAKRNHVPSRLAARS